MSKVIYIKVSMYIVIVIVSFVGICQSYVSRFLKGDLYEMSERSRHAICKWYLKYRSNPALIGKKALVDCCMFLTCLPSLFSVSLFQPFFSQVPILPPFIKSVIFVTL